MTTSPPRRLPNRAGKQALAAPNDNLGDKQPPAAVVAVKRLFAAETGNYFLLLGTTLFLVVFGLVMVLSSSAVTSFTESNNFFGGFERQLLFASLGVPIMLLASRMPAIFWKKWAGLAVVLGVGLQLLTVATPLGYAVGGNRNWIDLGAFSLQPSELVKLALVIWLGTVLARKQDVLGNWKEAAIPVLPVAGAAIGFVLFGKDLGTAIIMTALVLGAVYFAGVRLRHLAVLLVAIAGAGFILAFATLSRQNRIAVWQSGCTSAADYSNECWQTVHGWWALASGGIFGVGLGNSKAKWNWLPEADNDFIFAIIGEELGLIGAVLVLVLFVVMAIACVRIIRANPDPFAKITVSAVMVWIIGQAFVNIAVVLGVLPVLGVPLPLISSGGTALISSMTAIGIVLSFARQASGRRPDHPQSQPWVRRP
ncbi:MAG: ftsW [Homoserinimonas sp.]|nr:ftsW [Homoserinimonas sp.]